MAGALAMIDRIAGLMLRGVTLFCFLALLAILSLNVLSRYAGLWSLSWLDEVVVALFAWMVFIGAAALWREREHFMIELLPAVCTSATVLALLRVIVALLGLAFAVALLWYGSLFVGRVAVRTPILGLPQAWSYACMPIAGAVMTVYALRDVVEALVTLVRGDDVTSLR